MILSHHSSVVLISSLHVLQQHRLGGWDGKRNCLRPADAQLHFCRQPHGLDHRRMERIHIDSLPSQTEKNKLRSIDQVGGGGHRVDHDGKRLPWSDQHGLQRPRRVIPAIKIRSLWPSTMPRQFKPKGFDRSSYNKYT